MIQSERVKKSLIYRSDSQKWECTKSNSAKNSKIWWKWEIWWDCAAKCSTVSDYMQMYQLILIWNTLQNSIYLWKFASHHNISIQWFFVIKWNFTILKLHQLIIPYMQMSFRVRNWIFGSLVTRLQQLYSWQHLVLWSSFSNFSSLI